MKWRIIGIILFSFWINMARGQNAIDTIQEIDNIFSDRYKSENPGCQLAICKGGKLIYSKAWGMADLEHQVPLTVNSIIEAGSVSKQFVAACILLLEQQGKLSMSDDIRKYFSELPDYGKVITLDHMMRHTSGFKDWGAIADLAGWPRSTKTYSNKDAFEIMCRQKTLNHDPGDEFMYSNSNYNLFALLIEKVSGMSLAEYSKKYIFDPAGMENTQWRNDFKKVVPNRAIAYVKVDSVYKTEMPNEYVYGNGGLLTTAEDLLKWNEFYQKGKFGDPDLLPKMIAAYQLNNGAYNNYAAGLFIDDRHGYSWIQHNGATAGYRSYLGYFPDLDLSVAWLSNTGEFDGNGQIAYEVENLFLEPDIEENMVEKAMVEEKILKKYVGYYRNIMSNYPALVYLDDGNLKVNYTELNPVNDSVFASGRNQFVFNGNKLLTIIPSGDTIVSVKEEEGKSGNKYLLPFTGEYYSEETQSSVWIQTGSEGLIMYRKSSESIRLTTSYLNAFTAEEFGGVVYFPAKKKGETQKMEISIPRARKVIYEWKPEKK